MLILLSAILTFIFIFIFIYLAPKLRLIDYPTSRKIHKGSIPLVGGIAIYLNLIIYIYFFNQDSVIKFFIFNSFFILLIGLIDDIKNIGVIIRLIIQTIITLLIIGSGLYIIDIGDYYFFHPIKLYSFSIVLTTLSVIVLTNAINFIDGIDGLSAGVLLNAFISLIAFNLIFFNHADNTIIIYISVSIFIFLIFNLSFFKLKKIFLGDSGSMTLGFILSWFLIYYSHPDQRFLHPVMVIWCIALPIYDLLSVVIRRLLRKINPFKPDRRHIHYLLLDAGLDQRIVFYILILISVFISGFGGIIYYLFGPSMTLLSFMILFLIYFYLNLQLSRKTINIKKFISK